MAMPGWTVIWDFGGVLLHWDPGALVAQHLGEVPATDDADRARRFFGNYEGDWAEFDRGSLGRDAVVRSIVARTGWRRDGVAAVVDGVPHALQADSDTVGLLQGLWDSGVSTRYLSNMPAPYVPVILQRFGFLARFPGGLFSAHEGVVKPERAIYALATERWQLRASRTVFIDDAVVNVEAARAFGWHAIHYQGAADCAERLRALGVDCSFRSRASA
jgi:putative hydrolase of the HAD superfamily